MARITHEQVRELAGMKGDGAPVTSCYLNIDGRRFIRAQDYELHLDELLRRGRERVAAGGFEGAARKSLDSDLQRIEEHVKGGIDRSNVRGLALFSCTAAGFWQVVDAPVPVRNHLVINATPHVRQLEAIVDEYPRFAVVLADKQRARVLVFEQGELVEKEERFDQLPRHEDDYANFGRDNAAHVVDEAVHKHLKRAAEVAFHVFQEQSFDHVIIGAPDEIASALERELHPYLQERIAARVSVRVSASDDEIRRAALEVEEQVERGAEAAAVDRLRDGIGTGTGVAGLDDTLLALVERRVEQLLVSEGYETSGWRCPSCGWIGTRGRTCPVDSAQMMQAEDVVEEAVEEALAQSCRVTMCRDNADLDVLGRIGAILRF